MNKGQFTTFYTKEMIDFLREYAPGHSYVDITAAFNEKFNLNKSVKSIGSTLKRNRIKNGIDMRFSTDHIPMNKGAKMSPEMYEKCKATMFKPGNVPTNYKPVGSERVNVDGYVEIKTQDPNVWELKHRYVYSQHYGPVPDNHAVIFLDQNKLNCNIENLKLVPRKYLGMINHIGLGDIAEINEATINLAGLQVEINKRKKERTKKC